MFPVFKKLKNTNYDEKIKQRINKNKKILIDALFYLKRKL